MISRWARKSELRSIACFSWSFGPPLQTLACHRQRSDPIQLTEYFLEVGEDLLSCSRHCSHRWDPSQLIAVKVGYYLCLKCHQLNYHQSLIWFSHGPSHSFLVNYFLLILNRKRRLVTRRLEIYSCLWECPSTKNSPCSFMSQRVLFWSYSFLHSSFMIPRSHQLPIFSTRTFHFGAWWNSFRWVAIYCSLVPWDSIWDQQSLVAYP